MTAIIEDALSLEYREWGTLNTAVASVKLPASHTPNADNVWVDEKPGSVITAPGYKKVGTLPSNLPPTLCLNFFKTSDGTQTFIVSDNATVWTTRDFVNFTSIITGLAANFQLRAKVIRDKVWFTNGSDAVRTFDGAAVVVLDGSGGTPTVPKGRYIEYKDERVWLYHIVGDRSKAAFSALADNTGVVIVPDNVSAWPASNTLQISEGDNDFGTGLKYFNGYLYAFKQYHVYRIVGYDEFTYSRVKTRAPTGTRFAESIQELDGVLKFIGVDGFYEFDGEDAVRVSDLIDPADTSTGTFGFKDLQQPFLNNNFWTTTLAADFSGGTLPTNFSTAGDQLSLVAADDSQADFASGILSNIDITTNSGLIQLSLVPSGGSSINVSQGKNASRDDSGHGFQRVGLDSYITDGNTANPTGFYCTANGAGMTWTVDLGSYTPVGNATLRGFYFDRNDSALSYSLADVEVNTGAYQAPGQANGTWVNVGNIALPAGTFSSTRHTNFAPSITGGFFVDPTDFSVNFNTIVGIQVRFHLVANSGYLTISELEVYKAGYQPNGKFTSKALNYTAAPATFGTLTANATLNGESVTYFTQSSSDGVTWDSEVAVASGSAIGSALKQYLRWGAYLSSSTGINTPTIDSVFVGGTFISSTFDTGGSIYAWGAYEVNQNFNGQTINHYYRTATTLGGLSAASWVAISPGAALTASVANKAVQFKIEMSLTDPTRQPQVLDVTVNWIKSDGTSSQTLQNVGSIIWHNRYWLTAARRGSSADNVVIIRGKKTLGSPWQRKPWSILSFCVYQGNLYGGSSVDGSIYRLDTGYSLNGAAMDSFFETGDFEKGGFILQVLEVDIEVERLGPYTLSFGVSTDRGVSYTEKTVNLAVTTGPGSFVKKLLFNMTSDKFRFRVRTNGADQPFQVHNIVVWYTVQPARGSIK